MGERGICSSSSSLPLRLVWIIVPLIVVSGLVGLTGTRTSNWVFTSNHYPWVWSSVVQSSSSYNSAIFVGPNSTLRGSEQEGSGAHSDLNPSLKSVLDKPVLQSKKLQLMEIKRKTQTLYPQVPCIGTPTPFRGATWKWKSNSRYSSTKKESSTQFFTTVRAGAYMRWREILFTIWRLASSAQKIPKKAHVFFLPFSVSSIVRFVYERESHNWAPLKQTVKDYVHLVGRKYPYWNRSLGADHFMLACHDWGPELSSAVPDLYKNSIRALCNANTSEGFNPTKDVSFPEILLHDGTMNHLLGGAIPFQTPGIGFLCRWGPWPLLGRSSSSIGKTRTKTCKSTSTSRRAFPITG
ncbi:exostosin family protein [Actinidia rufa]|uniref:Exostosin family protein n=1 Tax=Actinidia rufa TaxID=165716 RepID=A0A7J0E8A8_9ERIC|nr:exostosin family protein [Actinidia rufa]